MTELSGRPHLPQGPDESLLLALDTSTEVGSVGLCRGDDVLAYRLLLEERAHASALVPQIAGVLDDASIARSEVNGVIVGHGPGSFTGVRVAAATARGLAKGLRIPLWHYSSLAAGAASYDAPIAAELPRGPGWTRPSLEARAAGWPRFVLFDARGDRVYAACYHFTPDGIETLTEATATTLPKVLASAVTKPVLFCGSGAVKHADLIRAAGYPVVPFPVGTPTPHGLLRLHRSNPGFAPVDLASRWEPEYLKGSSARVPTGVTDRAP